MNGEKKKRKSELEVEVDGLSGNGGKREEKRMCVVEERGEKEK